MSQKSHCENNSMPTTNFSNDRASKNTNFTLANGGASNEGETTNNQKV